jgi:hypothetical protein
MHNRFILGASLLIGLVVGATGARGSGDDGPPRKVLHRQVIAAVADRPERTLEGWGGPGISSVLDLKNRLEQVSAHWAWLSRGRETLEWTTVRITLPEPIAPESYNGDLAAFRSVTAALVRERVDARRFDADRDGELDTVFVLVANHGAYHPWLGRGPRPDGGANQFVEVQDAPTLLNRASGEIVNQLAGTLGVHDLVGRFDTVGALSVMSHRWAIPGADFTAVERAALGWLKPRHLPPGRHTVRLVDGGDDGRAMDGVRINTARPDEFVLLEFRHRRFTGGVFVPPEDGVIVHHVLQGANQQFDPPFHRIVAADGVLAPGEALQGDDVLTPANAPLLLPLVVDSVVDGAPVLQIDDVAAANDDAVVVTLEVFTPPTRENLLRNSGFELGTPTTAPDWRPDGWTPTSQFFRDRWRPYDGRYAASIKSTLENDARWEQDVDGLVAGAPYLLCGALRGRAVTRGPGVEVGGNLSVRGMGWFDRSEVLLYGSFPWTRVCYPFVSPSTSVTALCRLGFYASLARGQLWCDDLTLEPLERVFASSP